MRRPVFACVTAAAVAVLAAGASSATPPSPSAGQPAWSPDGTRLAYSASGENGHLADAFISTVEGSAHTDLTAEGSASSYGEPTWSTDGRRLAFVATIRSGIQNALFGYMIADADGSTVTQVGSSPTVGTPSFSPDGRYLAFDGFEAVVVARTDGSAQRRIAAPAGYPVFSPRQGRVAFVLVDRTDQGHIYTANPDGSARRRLTRSRGFDVPLAWSHGGRYLLFHTDREAFETRDRKTDAIYAMRSDGTGQHRVGYGREADFSPGAARVVFTGISGGLWIARLGGSSRRQLVTGVVHDPRWSPDGLWIAYTLTIGDASRIELIHPDGSRRHVFAP